MIYAIRAVGTHFIKFGRTESIGKRLKSLETACPFDLHLEACADWPDEMESAVHLFLEAFAERGEWFRDGDRPQALIAWLNDREAGLTRFQYEFAKLRKPTWIAPIKRPKPRSPRVSEEPTLNMDVDLKANERYEHIKQRALARQAAKRRQEAIS